MPLFSLLNAFSYAKIKPTEKLNKLQLTIKLQNIFKKITYVKWTKCVAQLIDLD